MTPINDAVAGPEPRLKEEDPLNILVVKVQALTHRHLTGEIDNEEWEKLVKKLLGEK